LKNTTFLLYSYCIQRHCASRVRFCSKVWCTPQYLVRITYYMYS
jgi:hypothetical protein